MMLSKKSSKDGVPWLKMAHSSQKVIVAVKGRGWPRAGRSMWMPRRAKSACSCSSKNRNRAIRGGGRQVGWYVVQVDVSDEAMGRLCSVSPMNQPLPRGVADWHAKTSFAHSRLGRRRGGLEGLEGD